MTKLKSKKMSKSTFAIIIMAILMVAMLAFGGTYAYFTATTRFDDTTLTLGYVKLSDNNAFETLQLENVLPGDEIVKAGNYDQDEGIILTVDTTDRAGNYVAVRFDFQITLEDGKTPKTVLNAQTVYGTEGFASKLDAQSVAYTNIYNSLKADNIKGGSNAMNIVASTKDGTGTDFTEALNAYYWDNYDTNKNVYFLVADETGADTDSLQAVGVAKSSVTADDKYATTVELIVNKEAFVLNKEIADNWYEGDDDAAVDSQYGIMEATIEIVMTAASVQASNITKADAQGQLLGLLTGYNFEQGKMNNNGYNGGYVAP